MAVADIDFEGAGNQGEQTPPAQNPTTGTNPTNPTEDVTNLGGDEVDDVTGKDGNNNVKPSETKPDGDDDNSSTGELAVGDTVEVDGTTYTVNDKGDLVDDKGNVFKEAKDIPAWLSSVNVEETDGNDATFDITNLQKELGVTVTDENGKPVEFTNDAAGVKSYVDSVISIKSNELQQAAINRLYQDNPMLKQFQDYVQLTGSPRGFGELPDRSGIQLDKDNESQLIAVIKMAANEFGNKSLNDNYIKYLRDSGGLYDEAKNQLDALVEKDKSVRKDIETRAEQQRKDAEAEMQVYWDNVKNVISKREIGGYKIPESFTKEVDGKKIVITPNDFFDYVSKPIRTEDGETKTGYQRDLGKLTDAEYLNREMLDAWLMFTGGTYKDLIDMAVKEDKVRQLRVKSAEQRTAKSVKIVKNNKGKASIDDIIL